MRRIYVERAVSDHPRAAAIRGRFPNAEEVPCSRWGEVFNRRHQSFRLQKRRPGMFRSAHCVLFVNYEDLQRAIDERLAEADADDETSFFSGYDCDSLAPLAQRDGMVALPADLERERVSF